MAYYECQTSGGTPLKVQLKVYGSNPDNSFALPDYKSFFERYGAIYETSAMFFFLFLFLVTGGQKQIENENNTTKTLT